MARVCSFEVTAFSSVEELRAPQVGTVPFVEQGWPFDVPRLPADATAADVQAGRVQLDLRADGAWARSWPEIELELFRLGRVIDGLVESARCGEEVSEPMWGFARGVHRAAAWSLGVADVMPNKAGRGSVSDVSIHEAIVSAAGWRFRSVWWYEAEGAAGWLTWLQGEDWTKYPEQE